MITTPPTRRDRRGRGLRGPLAVPAVPAMSTRREAFDGLVAATAARLTRALGTRCAGVEFAIEEVPPPPAEWEPQAPVTGRLFPAHGSHPARVVVYRRPVEARALDRRDLAEIVLEVLVEQVAAHLAVPAEEIEDLLG